MNKRDDVGGYLRGLAKRTADRYRAKVVERLPNNVLLVEDMATGAKSYAKANAGDFHKIGSWVEVLAANTSGKSVGALDTIVTRAPERGLSEKPPASRTEYNVRPIVISVDPVPLELEAGGSADEQVILGANLTEAGNYVAHGDGAAPDIEDAEAPDITESKVTRTIRADADSPIGTFDLVIHGFRTKRALRIVPRQLPEVLYVLAYSGTLYAVDPSSLNVIASYPGFGVDYGGISRFDTRVAVAVDDGLQLVNPSDGTTADVPVAWPMDQKPYFATRAGAFVYFRPRGTTTRISRLSAAGVITDFPVDGFDTGVQDRPITHYNGIVWVGDAQPRILRLDVASGTTSVVGMPDAGTFDVLVHQGVLYVSGEDGAVWSRDASTGAAVDSLTLPGATGRAYLASAGGKLFAAISTTALKVYELAADLTSAIERASFAGGGQGQVASSERAIFIADFNTGEVHRVAADDYAVTSAVIDEAGVDNAFMYAL